jgi:hypothetical protein
LYDWALAEKLVECFVEQFVRALVRRLGQPPREALGEHRWRRSEFREAGDVAD